MPAKAKWGLRGRRKMMGRPPAGIEDRRASNRPPIAQAVFQNDQPAGRRRLAHADQFESAIRPGGEMRLNLRPEDDPCRLKWIRRTVGVQGGQRVGHELGAVVV